MTTTYKPEPGSPGDRAVQLLRFLPAGTALNADELRNRAEITDAGSLHIHLHKVTSQRLLRAEKREGEQGIRTYWMDARGVAVWADFPTPSAST